MNIIRRIRKGEWELYKQLRLASLKDAPEAFSTTYESAVERAPESWVAQADASAEGLDRFTYFAFVEEAPAGLAALYRDADGSAQGEIIQLWISPAFRGNGLADELVNVIISCAKNHGFDKIRAEVMTTNRRARRFHEKHGFKIDGSPSRHSGHSVVLTKALGSHQGSNAVLAG
jgi:RimJ/RimL family protein N-acetyltransferase